MYGRSIVCGVLTLVLLLSSCIARAGLLEKFAALEQEMEAATEALHEASEHGGEHGPTPTGTRKSTLYKRGNILERMDALARRAKDAPHGATIEAGTFLWSLEIEPENAFARFAGLASRYPNEPDLEEPIGYVVYAYAASEQPRAWIDVLKRLAETTIRKETRLAALYAAGVIALETGKPGDAKKVFKKTLALGPESEFAEATRVYLREIEHLQIGMVGPDFTTKTLDGREVSLKSLRGKVVLLDVWATWCPPCIAEIPHLKKAAERFAAEPFEILTVSVDDDREAVLSVVESLKLPGIHTWDEKGMENPVANLYAVQRYPTWFLLDRDGVIRARDPFGDKLIPAIEPLLSSARSAAPSQATTTSQ